MTFRVVDQFPSPPKKPDFFPDKVDMGRGGVGVRVRVRVRIVSNVVLWAFFEISLQPHVGHTNFPDFLYFILDNNPFVR